MNALLFTTGVLVVWLYIVLTVQRRYYRKAKETLTHAKKVFEKAQESLAEAEKMKKEAEVDIAFQKAANGQRWYRHYAFYPLGQLPVSELSKSDMFRIRNELSVILGKRIRKYFEPKETVMNGQRVMMIDLLMKENEIEKQS